MSSVTFRPILRQAARSILELAPLSSRSSGKQSFATPASSSEPSRSNGPLTGIKILDLSRVLAAPFATQILADYGAEVIKIEDVARGDDTRHWRSGDEDPIWKPGIGPMSTYFIAVNRNKRSICLDLKQESGRKIFFDLAREADVIVENMRPGVTERLGIDYNAVSSENPGIIYASVSGYGPTGPYANRAGYDMIAGAEGGMLHLTGTRGGPPVRPGLGLTDMCTGLFTHGAILAALHARKETGKGQHITSSLFESQVSLLTNVASSWLNLGQEAERWGCQHPSIVPYNAFKTGDDQYFVCGATNDMQFRTLCAKLGLDTLPDDTRFATNANRVSNREELSVLINEAFMQKTSAEWLEIFEDSGMPYAPINTIQKVFEHPQMKARDMVTEVPSDSASSGTIHLVGPAVKFSDTKTSYRRQPPRLGEHSKEILRELGYSKKRIEDLQRSRVI